VVHDRGDPGDELEVAGDGAARRGAGEELRGVERAVVHEDAAPREREQVPAQQPARVDGVAPRPADSPGHGQAPRREAAQDLGGEVVGQLPHRRRHPVSYAERIGRAAVAERRI
jgi:hypothetical protein